MLAAAGLFLAALRPVPPLAPSPLSAPDDGERRIVAAELVVADTTPGFEAAVSRLGFTVLERRDLTGLGVSIARLRLPDGLDAPAGRALLRHRIPGLIADYVDLYRTDGPSSGAAADPRRRPL
jgi:hypothetical protein